MILYFSATGNCQYVADRIAAALNDTAVSIEKLQNSITITEGEVFGLVTPVYFWELPMNMRRFLKALTINGIPAYSFMITTYGTTPGCTFSEAKKLLLKKNVQLKAGYSIRMPDTWTPLFDLNNQNENAAINLKADSSIDQVIIQIQNRALGNMMSRSKSIAVKLITDPLYNSARKTRKLYAEDHCTGCGLCEKQCPEKAISIQNNKPVWIKKQCLLCLRCLHHCPVFAIQYGNGSTKIHGQYRHPDTKI